MPFRLVLLVNAVLFIRPAEVVPALSDLPIYAALISSCMLLSFPVVFDQLSPRSLSTRPITVCVVGLLIAVVLSHLARSSTWDARIRGFEFAKLVNYYLLMVGLITTTARLRRLLAWLVGLVAIVAAMALLQHHGLLAIDALDAVSQAGIDPETGEAFTVQRLCGPGIFHDPNDLGMILVTVMVACLYLMGNARSKIARVSWMALLGLFGVALAETHSRGGFLALLAASLVLFQSRFGTWKTIPLASAAVPLLFALFAGRQTNLTLADDTGQARIQLWSHGLTELRASPWFGIGSGRYVEEVGQVAHNSFVHAFTELGFAGGVLFLGAFSLALRGLHRLGSRRRVPTDPELARLRPYLLAMVAGYTAGMLSLSRTEVVPTYMILALATVYLNLVGRDRAARVPHLDVRLVRSLVLDGLAFLACTYVFVRLFARWG